MGAVKSDLEIPLLSSFLYLSSEAESGARAPRFWHCKSAAAGRPSRGDRCGRSALKTVSGGEFDWGGTSVKR